MKLQLLLSFILCWWVYGCVTAAKPPVNKTFRHIPLHRHQRPVAPRFTKGSVPNEDGSANAVRYFPRPDCPWPYNRIGRICRHINEVQNLSWDEARPSCGAIDGDLTTVNEPLLVDVLAYYKGVFRHNGYLTVWIGGKREDANSDFLWLTGGALPDPTSELWNYQDIPGFDCVALEETATKDIKLTNMNCSITMYFMCDCGLCTQ